HTHGLPLFVDNTVTTPYLVRPLSLGADVVIHSTSKAINGNGNSVGGIVVVGRFPWNAEKFPKLKEFSAYGTMSYLARLGACMRTDYGSSLSPFNAYLTGIGLDTLALRMERACENAMALADDFRSKDSVTVHYPGLPDHPGHELARRQFAGHYGAMLTLRLGSQERAFRFINHLSLALNVSNIGDARTLVIHPWSTIYLHASEEEKARAGVTDDLVRVSVGIEDKDDLLDDFEQALEKSLISEKQEGAVSKPKIYKSVTELIGGTPLLKAVNFEKANAVEANLLVKLEFFNPAGSVKDRIAKAMIETAEQEGKLKEGSVIVEPTSGNTGIGLASVAAARGYRTILTMPETMSVERRNLLKAYGAEIVLTEGHKGMKGAIAKAEEIANETPNAFIPSQFTNQANPAAHEATTGPEIWQDTDGEVDVFIAGVGTGGTLTGVGRYLKRQKPSVKIIAVEPQSSPVLSQGKAGPHKIQGIGAGFVPETLDTSVYDEVLPISNEEAFQYGRQFARAEGVLVGISAGAALAAAVKIAARDEFKGKTIVALLPDTGDRYLSTGLFSE
ncbi:MAG: cysteine synthase A, partial [Thermoguttaceae bacterium]|nr:cysteine synthase A [Thermoguttaceae bacterium]